MWSPLLFDPQPSRPSQDSCCRGCEFAEPRHFSADTAMAKDSKLKETHKVRLTVKVQNLTNYFNPGKGDSNIADPTRAHC